MNPEFDEVLSNIRNDNPDPAAVEAAAARAWTGLQAAHGDAPLRTCDEFQAMIPALRQGTLPEPRKLLLKDHARDCIACRKALYGETAKIVEMPAKPRWWPARSSRWAIAATLVVALGGAAWSLLQNYSGPEFASSAVVQAADGALYRVSPGGTRLLAAGEQVTGRESVRTAKDAHAVLRLKDGSLVEMRERTELSLSETLRDLKVRLDRGSVIVQAAKRRSGHLYVGTPDCKVAVVGTVFSVNRGTKGSRVSVVEGQVQVTQGQKEILLHPGEQMATADGVGRVPVEDEIAWSRNVDNYLALLRELHAYRKDLETVKTPGVRYTSRILDMLPADTAVYVALPNIGQALADAHRLLQDRIRQNEQLRAWWEKQGARGDVDQVIEEVRAFSEYLGDEIVVAVAARDGRIGEPVVIAPVIRSGLREFLEKESAKIGGKPHYALSGGWLALSPSATALSEVTPLLDQPGAGGFARTPFRARIADAYHDGAGLVVAADVTKIAGRPKKNNRDAETLGKTGVGDIRYVVLEQRDLIGKSDPRIEITFAGPRRGMTSWLAAPAAIGSLEFVSPEATMALGLVLKSPVSVVDDIFSIAGGSDRKLSQEVAEAESHLGISVRDDLAAALGGEIAFAIDGPALPIPSWKLAAEVYDPVRLQNTIERMVQGIARESNKKIALDSEQAGGRTYYVLRVPDGGPLLEAHYTFVDGYLVAAPSRPLLEKAIQYRSTGYTLPRSATFTSLAPRDRHASFSAVLYQNAGSVIGGVLDTVGGMNLTPEQREKLNKLAAESKPSLLYAYAQEDRIQIASSGGFFGFSVADLAGMGGPGGFAQILGGPREHRMPHLRKAK